MKKTRILVSAIGGDLGQSVIRCLRDSPYQPFILGCDMNPYAAGRSDVDDFMKAPPVTQDQRYCEFLLDIIQEKMIDYIFLISEPEILFFSRHRELFHPHEKKFLIHRSQVIESFMDKFETVRFFKRNGVTVPQTFLPSEYQGQLSFPLIIKKRRGSGSKNLHLIQNNRQLECVLMESHDLILQEYLPGENNEYTSAIFKSGDNIHKISFKRILGQGGYSQQVELVINPMIEDFLDSIALSIDFSGSINIQFKVVEKRGCIPFEINPRFSSTVYMRHVFGFTDVVWWLDMKEGKNFSYSSKYSQGIGVRKMTEVFFDMK